MSYQGNILVKNQKDEIKKLLEKQKSIQDVFRDNFFHIKGIDDLKKRLDSTIGSLEEIDINSVKLVSNSLIFDLGMKIDEEELELPVDLCLKDILSKSDYFQNYSFTWDHKKTIDFADDRWAVMNNFLLWGKFKRKLKISGTLINGELKAEFLSGLSLKNKLIIAIILFLILFTAILLIPGIYAGFTKGI